MTATPDADAGAGKAQGKERPDKCPDCGLPALQTNGGTTIFGCYRAVSDRYSLSSETEDCRRAQITALRAANARLAEELAEAKAKLNLPCECCTSLDDERERSNQLGRVIEKIAATLGIDRDNDPVVDEALSEHTEDDEECWGIDAMHRLIVERIAVLESQLAALRQQQEAMVPRDVALRACEEAARRGYWNHAQVSRNEVPIEDANKTWGDIGADALTFALREAAQRGAHDDEKGKGEAP